MHLDIDLKFTQFLLFYFYSLFRELYYTKIVILQLLSKSPYNVQAITLSENCKSFAKRREFKKPENIQHKNTYLLCPDTNLLRSKLHFV